MKFHTLLCICHPSRYRNIYTTVSASLHYASWIDCAPWQKSVFWAIFWIECAHCNDKYSVLKSYQVALEHICVLRFSNLLSVWAASYRIPFALFWIFLFTVWHQRRGLLFVKCIIKVVGWVYFAKVFFQDRRRKSLRIHEYSSSLVA